MPNILGHRLPDVSRSQIVPATPIQESGTAPKVFNFPEIFDGYAIDLSINNLDSSGTLTYRINSRSNPAQTVSISGVVTLTDTQIVLLEIVSGSNWEITFNLVPLPSGGRGE